ncbi:uncharacterized protein METZ01_LOCUS138984, partial [marine metagenome]
AKIYTVTISCEDSHIDGLKNYGSNNIEVAWGNYDCTTHAGIYSMYSKGGVYRDLNLDSNHRGIFFFANTGVPNSASSNYINDTNIYNSGNAAIYFDGADNNTVYRCNIHDQWNGISFLWGANDNTVKEVDFQDSSNYDIYHGGCGPNHCGGWNNVLIDNVFDDFDLYIDSASRLLEKSLVKTTVTANWTHSWNRANKTIDPDRRAFSGTNSFWAGSAKDDTYLDNWNSSFKMNSSVSLPSGGSEENRTLEIKTWYETEATFDGGRVYISKNSGTTWSLLTPIDGYDGNLEATCNFDGGAFHGDKSALGWQTKEFDLSDYRGEDIRIKFNFCSDGSQVEEGWYIDDIKIYKYSDPSVVDYFEDFERIGHKWIFPGTWVPEGDATNYVGKEDVNVLIVDGSSAEAFLNHTINQNLVNFWKFNESSGYTYDSVQTTRYAYLQSGASYTSGKFGNGINFDGTNDYVYSRNDMYSPGRYTEVTISAWVKFDSFPASGNYESLVNPRYDGDAFIQVDSDGKPVFGGYFYGTPSGEQRATGSTTMVTGVWYHIAGTWSEDTDKLEVYLNGTLEGTNSFSGTSAYLRTGSYNYFGRDYNGRYMDGILDHVAIWSTDLSEAAIQAIYHTPLAGDRLYATKYFRGTDDKTDSNGKLVDLYVVTKVYGGSDVPTASDTYIELQYELWSQISSDTISNNVFMANVTDTRVYNRNDGSQYIWISEAVAASSSSDVIELWPGTYKENVVINKRLTIIGSGQSKTIVDGDYAASVFKFDNSQTDYSIIKNLRVSHSKTGTSSCSSTLTYGGIHLYYSDHVTINNVHFFETYNGLMTYASTHLKVQNSTFDRGTVSGYYGMFICGTSSAQSHYLIENNEIKKYNIGISLQALYEDIDIYNNHIHN